MPSVALHYGPDHSLNAEHFKKLGDALVDAAQRVLGAELDKIQVMPIELAHTPVGRPIYIEIKARDTASRPDELLQSFVDEVDEISFQAFKVRCRIRYFKYPGTFLVATN